MFEIFEITKTDLLILIASCSIVEVMLLSIVVALLLDVLRAVRRDEQPKSKGG